VPIDSITDLFYQVQASGYGADGKPYEITPLSKYEDYATQSPLIDSYSWISHNMLDAIIAVRSKTQICTVDSLLWIAMLMSCFWWIIFDGLFVWIMHSLNWYTSANIGKLDFFDNDIYAVSPNLFNTSISKFLYINEQNSYPNFFLDEALYTPQG